jgi:DNA repair protein RecN (Recombination protein N)
MIGDELVDLHGSHDHQSLLSPDRQLALLDGFAHAERFVQEYQECFRLLQGLVAEEESLRTAESARAQELDLLRHQVGEITAAHLQPKMRRKLRAPSWRRTVNA